MSNEEKYRAEVSTSRRKPKKDDVMIASMLTIVGSVIAALIVFFNVAFDLKTIIKKVPKVEEQVENTKEEVIEIDKRLVKIEAEHPIMMQQIRDIDRGVKALLGLNGIQPEGTHE